MRDFIRRHLDPADRLGEVLFGLIMALGFTAAVRLGREEPDNRELFIGILGCNIAWGIVDCVMYILTALFDRGRRARIVRAALSAPTEESALASVGEELDDRLAPLTTAEERLTIYRWVLELARRAQQEKVRVRREDLFGGIAAGLLVILATIPIVVPYLLIQNPHAAARVSHLTGLTLLFLVGASWGRAAGGSGWRLGLGLTALGLLLVGVTVVLGG
jgi:hypothetical protein